MLERELKALGFDVERITFEEDGTDPVENLYARIGDGSPHLMFAGHTDVVPPGDESRWTSPPFEGAVRDGMMIGRGAVDMKGGIACFLAAVEAWLGENGGKAPAHGSISFLITGDEEGPSINGTDKLLKWAAGKGEEWDGAIVGEPVNPQFIGQSLKNGRRGSLSGRITVHGVQGHSAYPHLADNPVNGLLDLLDALIATPFDEGSEDFPASNLQITSVDVGNRAVNVIPGEASAVFNIRFNDHWDGDTLKAEIVKRLEAGAASGRLRRDQDNPVSHSVEWIGRVSPVFLTRNEALTGRFATAIERVTGRKPELSTSGGTSDARFIKDYCPVVEFGLVGQTMHMVNEQVALADLDTLTDIYLAFLRDWFAAS